MPQSFVPQKDGTHLPSQELVDAVRANPEKYPNAVSDFSAASGKSEEEVQAILENKGYGDFRYDLAVDAIQGFRTGIQTAADKVGDLMGFGDNENVQKARKAAHDDIAAMDPKFDTEKGVGETLAEGVGQAAPAIVAGAAAGPSWLLASVYSAGAAYLTFEDEDNLVQMANDWQDGWVPDILVIDDDDDWATSTTKSIAANLIAETILRVEHT